MIAAIFNFVSTSNFISVHSQSLYKPSMIRFAHKVHFDVDFLITHRLYALSRNNLKNLDSIMFVRMVCKSCKLLLFLCCFFLLFIMCRLAKKDQKETKTKTHKWSKVLRKNPEAVKWIQVANDTIVYVVVPVPAYTSFREAGPAK